MADLTPTAARLALLADVDAGKVEADWFGRAHAADGRNISYAVNELRVAGWVTRPDNGQRWAKVELTATGRNVHDKHRARQTAEELIAVIRDGLTG